MIQHEKHCASLTKMLLVDPPRPAPCDCFLSKPAVTAIDLSNGVDESVECAVQGSKVVALRPVKSGVPPTPAPSLPALLRAMADQIEKADDEQPVAMICLPLYRAGGTGLPWTVGSELSNVTALGYFEIVKTLILDDLLDPEPN